MPGMKTLGWQIESADSAPVGVPYATGRRQTPSGDWLKAVSVEGA